MSNDSQKIYTECVNPATFEITGRYVRHTEEDFSDALASARNAQKQWLALSFDERKQKVLLARDYIAANSDKIAQTISDCTGKPLVDAMSTEVLAASMAITYYAKNAGRILKTKHLYPGNILTANKWSYVERAPYGVVGIITPWNYPFAIPMHEITMALMAGNAVILKVDPQVLPVGNLIEACLQASGLPEGLFTHLNLETSVSGDTFINGGIDKLFFTGSVRVGKYLAGKAAEKLLPLSLELGGNDAMIVCRDANIGRAVRGALWAGLSNAGQSCAGVERIYCDDFIYDEFVSRLKRELIKLRAAVGTAGADLGSLTTERQLNTVRRHIADALEKGATVYYGQSHSGENNKGYFHPPAILENVNSTMLVMQEETFGPVLAVDRFSSIDEAVTKANSSDLGLTASVWSANTAEARRTASRLEAGVVTVNDHLMSHGLAETPWGGWKNSGNGRTHSYCGLEAMTQSRTVVTDILPMLQKNIWWYPYSQEVYESLRGAVHALYSKNLNQRFNGLIKVSREFLRAFKK